MGPDGHIPRCVVAIEGSEKVMRTKCYYVHKSSEGGEDECPPRCPSLYQGRSLNVSSLTLSSPGLGPRCFSGRIGPMVPNSSLLRELVRVCVTCAMNCLPTKSLSETSDRL